MDGESLLLLQEFPDKISLQRACIYVVGQERIWLVTLERKFWWVNLITAVLRDQTATSIADVVWVFRLAHAPRFAIELVATLLSAFPKLGSSSMPSEQLRTTERHLPPLMSVTMWHWFDYSAYCSSTASSPYLCSLWSLISLADYTSNHHGGPFPEPSNSY